MDPTAHADVTADVQAMHQDPTKDSEPMIRSRVRPRTAGTTRDEGKTPMRTNMQSSNDLREQIHTTLCQLLERHSEFKRNQQLGLIPDAASFARTYAQAVNRLERLVLDATETTHLDVMDR